MLDQKARKRRRDKWCLFSQVSHSLPEVEVGGHDFMHLLRTLLKRRKWRPLLLLKHLSLSHLSSSPTTTFEGGGCTCFPSSSHLLMMLSSWMLFNVTSISSVWERCWLLNRLLPSLLFSLSSFLSSSLSFWRKQIRQSVTANVICVIVSSVCLLHQVLGLLYFCLTFSKAGGKRVSQRFHSFLRLSFQEECQGMNVWDASMCL